jgi:alcohol dehydrogenase YqhD (iron-dependent ADH family)
MKAVAIVKNKIDFILAVGGGSVIDGVKFISGAVNIMEINGDFTKHYLIKRMHSLLEQY